MNLKLIKGDCLEKMNLIPDNSIDAIITDLPYGTTACKWDSIIPFDDMWLKIDKLIKSNGAIVMFGSEPFSSKLRLSNLKMYKYDWIWDKVSTTSGVMAKKQPMKKHEIISVFYNKQPTYNPQMTIGTKWKRGGQNRNTPKIYGDEVKSIGKPKNDDSEMKYPKSILTVSNANRSNRLHPTQKPTDLLEYFIKTYTNENETVLDFTMGSATCAIACINTNRNFIGIEKDDNYFEIGNQRVIDYIKNNNIECSINY